MNEANLHTRQPTTESPALKRVNESGDSYAQNGTRHAEGFSLLPSVLAFLAIGALMIWMDPRISRWMHNKDSKAVPLGIVQNINFVGKLSGLSTQINTDRQTILVKGVANLPKGIQVEWRRSKLYGDLCVMGTDHCWDLLVGGAEREP